MQVLEELINLAKELDSATKRGEELGLTDDEVAFYDALAVNQSAVKTMGSAELRVIAAELLSAIWAEAQAGNLWRTTVSGAGSPPRPLVPATHRPMARCNINPPWHPTV